MAGAGWCGEERGCWGSFYSEEGRGAGALASSPTGQSRRWRGLASQGGLGVTSEEGGLGERGYQREERDT